MIPASASTKTRKTDPIAELIKCKDKEIRRVLLWSRRQMHKEALARQIRYSIYEAEFMELLWDPFSFRPSLASGLFKTFLPFARIQHDHYEVAFHGISFTMRLK